MTGNCSTLSLHRSLRTCQAVAGTRAAGSRPSQSHRRQPRSFAGSMNCGGGGGKGPRGEKALEGFKQAPSLSLFPSSLPTTCAFRHLPLLHLWSHFTQGRLQRCAFPIRPPVWLSENAREERRGVSRGSPLTFLLNSCADLSK